MDPRYAEKILQAPEMEKTEKDTFSYYLEKAVGGGLKALCEKHKKRNPSEIVNQLVKDFLSNITHS